MSISLVQNLFFIKHLRKRSLQAEFLKANLSTVTVRKKNPTNANSTTEYEDKLVLSCFLLRHINQSWNKAAILKQLWHPPFC